MIIDCISDLHGHYPELEGGDLLIVAGDLTAHDNSIEYLAFISWIAKLPYKKKIFIGGNHDNLLRGDKPKRWHHDNVDIEYICDSGTEFEGLKIWGSPWTKTFESMNPHCKAFTVDTEEELAEKWALIPNDIDILITHSPPYGILDQVKDYNSGKIECVGSKSLQYELFTRLKPKLFVCGHIHEGYGKEEPGGIVNMAINASHVNEYYEPVNKPIRIEL